MALGYWQVYTDI